MLDDNIIMLEVGVYISKTVAFVYEIKTLPNVSFNLWKSLRQNRFTVLQGRKCCLFFNLYMHTNMNYLEFLPIFYCLDVVYHFLFDVDLFDAVWEQQTVASCRMLLFCISKRSKVLDYPYFFNDYLLFSLKDIEVTMVVLAWAASRHGRAVGRN